MKLSPRDYQHIHAWGIIQKSLEYEIQAQQEQAAVHNAPATAVYYNLDEQRWITFEDCKVPTQVKLSKILSSLTKPEPTTTQPETELVAIDLGDRPNRRIILSVDNKQRCVVAAWVDEELNVPVARTYSGAALYNLLAKPTFKIGRASWGKKVWWKYLLPRRLTLSCNPAIYRWLWWNFSFDNTVE